LCPLPLVLSLGTTEKRCPSIDSSQPPGNQPLHPTTTQRVAPHIRCPLAAATPLQKASPRGTPAKPRALGVYLLLHSGGETASAGATASLPAPPPPRGGLLAPTAQDPEVSCSRSSNSEHGAASPVARSQARIHIAANATSQMSHCSSPHCNRHQQKKWRQEDEKQTLKLSVKNYGISPLAEKAFSNPRLLEADLRLPRGLHASPEAGPA